MSKDFWHNAKIAVLGGGHWGSVLAHLVSSHCREVRLWTRNEDQVRVMNATRCPPSAVQGFQWSDQVRVFSELERVFQGGVEAVIWALPSSACREQAKKVAPWLTGHELVFHATKGVEPGTLRRISEVLEEELPLRRIGVISGPNLAVEIAQGKPAATVIASSFLEVRLAGQALLTSPVFCVYQESDVIGVEWAGVLKNILAIAAGAFEALNLGWNSRAMLITRGLMEMVRFGVAMGAQESTFLSLSGVGDLIATCSSPLSRNYTVGFRIAQEEPLETVLKDLGSVAEGVETTYSVWEFAKKHHIEMPVTEGVFSLLKGQWSLQEMLHRLMISKL